MVKFGAIKLKRYFMKKILKTLAVCVFAGTLCIGAATLAACGETTPEITGSAYGLSHTGGYVACATVTVKGDEITDVTLNEVCLPTYVKDGDGNYYAEVSYGEVTLTYDEEAETYKAGDVALAEYFQTEANAKAYFDAVMANQVAVTVDGAADTTVLTKAALSKEENGYWTREDADGNEYSRWVLNRDATVAYVKANGVENLLNLVLSEEGVADSKEDKDVKYWMDGTVSTGATWADLNSNPTGYLSYAQLIVNAYNAAIAD